MKKNIVTVLMCSFLVFQSCNKESATPNENPVEAPDTYVFERNNNSSVSFSGQTTRLEMLTELSNSLKNNTNTEEQLLGMYTHEAGKSDFSSDELNASSKNIKSKIAASNEYFSTNTTESITIKNNLQQYISNQANEVFPKWNSTATPGNTGNLQQSGGGSVRYINGKGMELNQLFSKYAIGALILDQIVNNYLSSSVLDEGNNRSNNDTNTLEEGKNYTSMEHKWDEAFGYLYGKEENITTPTLSADSFLNNYLGKVNSDNDFEGIAQTVYNAFIVGRAAIVAKNYDVRDEQADIIKENLSKVIAIRAVHYFENGKLNIETDKATAFHELSEGIGFLQSLRFSHNPTTNQPYLPVNQINQYITLLNQNNGLWDVSLDSLSEIASTIASKFNFTVEQATN